jgi:hypothetical protein
MEGVPGPVNDSQVSQSRRDLGSPVNGRYEEGLLMAKRKRDITKVPSANIPSSMVRISKLKMFKSPRMSAAEPGSKSVYTVGGGLPDTKRSGH